LEFVSGRVLSSDTDGESIANTERSRSPSPLANKSKGKKAVQQREIRQYVPDGPECLPLPSECSDDVAIESEDGDSTEVFSQITEETEENSEKEEDDNDDEEEWVPPTAPTPKSRASKAANPRFSSVSSGGPFVAPTTTKTRASKGKVLKLEKEMQLLSLGGESDSDLSAYIHPTKKVRRVAAVDEESASEDELATIKKKKRFILFESLRA
jgi:kinesin family member 20